MSIKKFVAPSIREALTLVKETLGEDAYIVSEKKIAGGVEILAQPEYAPSTQTFSEPILVKKSAEWLHDPNIDALKAEVSQLKVLLQEELSQFAWKVDDSTKPWLSVIYERLMKMSVRPEAAKRILTYASKAHTLEEAERHIVSWISETFQNKGTFVPLHSAFFVGSPGSGKTAVLVSMMLQHVKQKNAQDFCVISFTPKKISGFEELRSFMRFFNVPVERCESETELKRMIEKNRHKKIFCELGSEIERENLHALAVQYPEFQMFWNIPLYATYDYLKTWHDKVAYIPTCQWVLTHADAPLPVGHIMSLYLQAAAPIAGLMKQEAHPTHFTPLTIEWLNEHFPFATTASELTTPSVEVKHAS